MDKKIVEAIARQIDLLRLSTTLSDEYAARLDDLEKQVINLANPEILKLYKKNELLKEIKALSDDINSVFEELGEEYEDLQFEIADNENDFLIWLFGLAVLSGERLKTIAKQSSGFDVRAVAEKQAIDLKYEFTGFLKNAWANAILNKKAITENPEQALKDIRAVVETVRQKFNRMKHRVKLTVKNTIATVAENVRYQFIMHNDDVNAIMHIAVLEKSCIVCTARNGAAWDKKTKEPLNNTLIFEKTPIHPNCRCHLYGIAWDRDNPINETVYNGDAWVKERSLEELQRQFGKQAGEMLYNGDITLNDMLNKYGLKRLTLKEIKDGLKNAKNSSTNN